MGGTASILQIVMKHGGKDAPSCGRRVVQNLGTVSCMVITSIDALLDFGFAPNTHACDRSKAAAWTAWLKVMSVEIPSTFALFPSEPPPPSTSRATSLVHSTGEMLRQ
jgi:hypothetical protein